MSATGRNIKGHERQPDDDYVTPAWAVRAILPHLLVDTVDHRLVLDPCCGEGYLLDEVKRAWGARTVGVELDAKRAAVAVRNGHNVGTRDALGPDAWPYAHIIITNPPYKLAIDFVLRALKTDRTAAFLLRLNFLASQQRAPFHKANPCDVYVLPRRPSFAHGRTDSTEYAWMVWGPGYGSRWAVLDCETPKLRRVDARTLPLPFPAERDTLPAPPSEEPA